MRAEDTWTTTPTLTVWAYDSPRGASAGQVRLRRLHRQGAVTVEDALTASWVRGAHRPLIEHVRLGPMTRRADVSPLGALLALLLDPPTGREAASLSEQYLGRTGLSEPFLAEVRRSLVPDASAMLVLSSRADFDAVRQVIERGIARGDVRLLHAILTTDAVEILGGLEDGRPTAGL